MLTDEENEEIKRICDKWVLRKEFPNLDNLYVRIKEIDFTPFIKAFTSRLDTIPCKFSKSEQVSGSVCFFGGVITSILHYGYIEEIEGLFTFALCYMLIDHYLDDNTISSKEKKNSMHGIYLFIHKGERSGNNHLINAAADRYLDLVERVPRCKQYLMRLFESELKGVKIQKRNDLSRETYLQIAEEKGGLTAAAIGSIIGLCEEKDELESMKLGALIQLVDDYIDIEDDTQLDIMTLVRYDLQNTNLDKYIHYSMKKIVELSNVYNFFKPILMKGLILGAHDNPNSISPELSIILSPYDTFSSNISKNNLNQWFHDKLYSYIDENI